MAAKQLNQTDVKRFVKWHERHVGLLLRDLEKKLRRGEFALEHSPDYVAAARKHLCESLATDLRVLCGEAVESERTRGGHTPGKSKRKRSRKA